MTNIIILGAGLGGIPMAYEMREAAPSADITVVSNNSYFQFTPSNPWVAVNWRKRDDIAFEIEPYLKKRRINFVASAAEKVEPEHNRVLLADGQTLTYDYLVIATGPELAFDEVEGLGPHGGHTQSICQVEHAVTASEKWEAFCKDPGPIVVGAVQGASCFGPAYEFAMILDTDLRKRKIRDKVPMTFVTAEPYIGHLGLDGVGDTKTLLESTFRDHDIKWVTNAKVDRVEDGTMHVTELNEDGETRKTHELPFAYSMMLPAFRGIGAVRDIEGLVNPRGFIITDKHQRNPKYPNVFGVGVCIAIPPVGPTPVPVGVPKTGFMIESMVSATAQNIRELIDGSEPTHEATWNAVCLADFGDSGVAFVAMPQIPPRNVNWSSDGRWVHLAKIAFEKYFLRKVRRGAIEPVYEKYVLKALGIGKLKEVRTVPGE
jgi:sulfide:quinone oxidoreductase